MKLMLEASIANRDSAIKMGGDGIVVELEIPETEAPKLPDLMEFKHTSFKLVFLTQDELWEKDDEEQRE